MINNDEKIILGYSILMIQKDTLGRSRPFVFASKSLTPAETRCAYIDYEMLPLLFGCMRFHHYLMVESSYARVTTSLLRT